jgi:hypothetical protein
MAAAIMLRGSRCPVFGSDCPSRGFGGARLLSGVRRAGQVSGGEENWGSAVGREVLVVVLACGPWYGARHGGR